MARGRSATTTQGPTTSPDKLVEKATAAMRARRRQDAETLIQQALRAKPGHGRALALLAVIRLETGRFAEARELIAKAARKAPDDPGIANDHGMILLETGSPEPALKPLRRATARRPGFAQAWSNLGKALAQLGHYRDALAAYDSAIAAKPDFADAHNNRGNLLLLLERGRAALTAYDRALSLRPGEPNYLINRTAALQALGRDSETRAAARDLIARAPKVPQGHNLLGNAELQLGNLEAAEAAYRQALAVAPNYHEAAGNLAKALYAQGRKADAEAAFADVLDRAPDYTPPWPALAELHKFRAGDPLADRLAKAAETIENRPPQDRVNLCFALGKAREDMGDPGAAIAWYARGGSEKQALAGYRFAQHDAPFLDQMLAHFTAEQRDRLRAAGAGIADESPVFIVGMPRSGTSLIEQMLASHGDVDGLGELNDFRQLVDRELQAVAPQPPGYDHLPHLDAEALTRIGTAYLAALRESYGATAARVTDKMPQNFLMLGLIRLALPRASIIHVTREPRATAVSCFKKAFIRRMYWTYALADIGAYYRRYSQLMDHWRALFPGEFLEVAYEDLVDSPEATARRLVDYIGLDWDPACLAFYENERPVMTASIDQVRQPVYTSAKDSWRKFADYLGPFEAALNGENAVSGG